MTLPKNPIDFPGVTRLLAYVSTLTGRRVDVAVAKAWQTVLANGYTYEECAWAVTTFFQNRPDDFIAPGHIVQIVNERRRDYDHTTAGGLYIADAWYYQMKWDETRDPRYAREVHDRYQGKSAVQAMESGEFDQ